MKTTLEIEDELFRNAKALAARQGIPMRRLHERALRQLLEQQRNQQQPRFVLADASVGGHGLQPGIDLANRDQMDELLHPTVPPASQQTPT